MSQVSTIAAGRNTKVFAKKETSPGAIVIPAAADMIVVNSVELKVPNPTFEDDKGLRGSRSVFNRYQTHIPAGTFKLQHYIRPSGSAGAAGEADCVFESAYGKKTVVGGTSVAYDPENTKPSFSLYVKDDHTVFAASGCVTDKLSIKKDNKGMLEVTEDGKFMSAVWTGTGSLGAAISTTPAAGTEEEFSVDDPKKFSTGSHVLVDTEQMQITGTAWEGTAASGKIKFKRGYNSSTVATHTINTPVGPWLPTGTETGAPLASRVGTLTIDAVSIPFLDIDHNHDDGVTMNEDEITGAQTPTDYYEGDRKVSGKLTVYFRKTDLKWFADAVKQVRKAVVLNFGSGAGKQVAITMGACELDMPELAADKAAQKIAVNYRAFATAGNDEAQLKFL